MLQRQLFQDRLRRLRAEKGMSQRQMAEHFGMTKSNYQNYEAGRGLPSLSMFDGLADFFDVSIDYLFGRSDVPQVARKAV